MIQTNKQFRTRDGRIAKVVATTEHNLIASMAGFAFRCLIEGAINEEYFVTNDGKKFDGVDSGYDLIESIEESTIEGDIKDPFFAMAHTLSNIETRWNLHGSMQFSN